MTPKGSIFPRTFSMSNKAREVSIALLAYRERENKLFHRGLAHNLHIPTLR